MNNETNLENQMNDLISDLKNTEIKDAEIKDVEIIEIKPEINEQPKRKRGRPRKITKGDDVNVGRNEITELETQNISGNITEDTSPKPSPEIEKPKLERNGKDKLADILSDYQEVKVNEVKDGTPPQPTVNLSHSDTLKINGALLLILCDAFAPLLIKLIFGMFQPELKKVPINKIRLTREQKEALEPIADKCAEYVFKETNPMTMFVISIGACYYSNAMENIPSK